MNLSELGYPVVSEEIHRKIFGSEVPKRMDREDGDRIKRLLGRFGIKVPVDYPGNLYNGPLPLPDLKGDCLKDHFESVAAKQVGGYKRAADEFSRATLPKIPTIGDFVKEPGWTRYEWFPDGDGKGYFKTEKVPYPLEEAFTFDTETFVNKGAYPILGTAVSAKAAYLWIASELLDLSIPEDKWDEYNLIPVGKGKFIAGHNISYDRIRTQEAYDLSNVEPESFFFDTLSAHVGVSGLASEQRWLYTLSTKDFDSLTEKEQNIIRVGPKWLDSGTTNSLVSCYNFHVCSESGDHKTLDIGDKAIRDIFVKANYLCEINSGDTFFMKILDYAMKDAYYTAELFKSIWPKYLERTPSMVALCGHYHLNGSIVPLVDNWEDWKKAAEEVYEEYNNEMDSICRRLMDDTLREWREVTKGCKDSEETALTTRIWARKDPWVNQLDWTIERTKGKYANIPNWLLPYIKEPDKKVGVKSRLSHLLLKLKYEGTPMKFIWGKGWCYTDGNGVVRKIPHPKGTGENVGGVITRDFVQDMEVGRLSSDLPEAKRALEISNGTSYWTSVRSRVLGRITKLASNPYGKDSLVTMPEILCHGTVTRRTVESLFLTMCSTKSWRIGTELKTRVSAPEGWKIVGADFDGQEMQIASIYSDHYEGKFVGCSPFGYNVLSGSKESGTDPHTALARAIMPELYKGLVWDRNLGVCERGDLTGDLTPIGKDRSKELSKARDLAKVVGFTVLYGGGANAIEAYIKKVYPEKSSEEVSKFAKLAIEKKKGQLIRHTYQESYENGSDSGCFNYMERIAIRSKTPTLPCLGTKISTALTPEVVGKSYKTGRINWTIQSSGAEILSIILTSVHWLAREYKIPCRFILSIHDEVWFMTPEKYAEQFAVLFQIAHMYTWSLFHSQVGIPELPLSRAYFSSVAIDNRVRKSPKESTVSPSNPGGGSEPNGVEYSMTELESIGAIKKLSTRFKAIKSNLI